MDEGCFATIYKIEDINDRKSYAMKIEEDTENLARETRVLLNIEKKSKSNLGGKKECISNVIDYGFVGLKNFSDQNTDDIKSFGFYIMPLYDMNLH